MVATGAAIDVHTHLLSADLAEIGFDTPVGTPASDADDLVLRLDEANIERAVILSLAYIDGIPGAAMRAENDWVSSEVAKFPERLIGFCGINPLQESGIEEVDRCLELPGMFGLKINVAGSRLDMGIDDHIGALSAVFDKARERDAPILIHLSSHLGRALFGKEFENAVSVIANHPAVRVVLAHCTARFDYDRDSRFEAWLEVLDANPPVLNPDNLFMDLSFCLEFWKDAPLSGKELMVGRFKKWGMERVFFGSDYLDARFSMASTYGPAETPKKALDTLVTFPFTQEEIDLILNNDASAWLYGE